MLHFLAQSHKFPLLDLLWLMGDISHHTWHFTSTRFHQSLQHLSSSIHQVPPPLSSSILSLSRNSAHIPWTTDSPNQEGIGPPSRLHRLEAWPLAQPLRSGLPGVPSVQHNAQLHHTVVLMTLVSTTSGLT
ncbi:hypothetical protein Pmani_003937 [Petrolisthes manimaculis]|uniref:Uncharacterized protein n=1 Tax=Petrolisthes manimaculis TaxID=1843537 RepID=A0AAE1QF14_9EUCA|nr:hypothetical protein Pmani_003937 [Petrolisthes manimaculis]